MRVLQINSVCGVGSTGRIATDLHEILIANEYESYIAFGRGEPKKCTNTIRIGSNLDNYRHVLSTRLFDNHGFASKNATLRFIEKIETLKPDIIHLHNIHGYYLNVEVLFNHVKKMNIPIIWTLHDCWAFTGHCAYFDYNGCHKWENGCNKCPQKNSYPRSLISDNSYANYQKKKTLFNEVSNLTIVTPSSWLKNLVEKSFLKNYEVKVINNGINLDIFKPLISNFKAEKNLTGKFIILGVASVWDNRKGLDYFKDLSEKVLPDEQIVLVGLTEKQIKQLPNNIIGISKTNNLEELVGIYSSADVFVNPTLEDNFPTTNLEALACGTPVITFETGGSVESIDETCGFVVAKGDINSLYETIKIIKHLGKSSFEKMARKKAQQNFNADDRFNDYLNLYKEVGIKEAH